MDEEPEGLDVLRQINHQLWKLNIRLTWAIAVLVLILAVLLAAMFGAGQIEVRPA